MFSRESVKHLKNPIVIITGAILFINLQNQSIKLYNSDLEAEEFITDSKDRKTLLIDVRNKSDFESFNMENSINVPLDNGKFEEFLKMRANNLERDQKIIFICNSGRKSRIAANQFATQGFTNVHSLSKGLSPLKEKYLKTNHKGDKLETHNK